MFGHSKHMHEERGRYGFGAYDVNGPCGRGARRGEHGFRREMRERMRGFGGPFSGPWERGEGRGDRHFGGRERLFEGGDLRLVILEMLAAQPSYGYQIIKRLEERMAGGYTPSAGVIYPTLTQLEEEGLTTGETVEGKKVFSVTDAGKALLRESEGRLKEIHARLDHSGGAFERGRAPEIMRAFMNLRGAIKARVVRGRMTPEQLQAIAAEIDKAAAAIDAL